MPRDPKTLSNLRAGSAGVARCGKGFGERTVSICNRTWIRSMCREFNRLMPRAHGCRQLTKREVNTSR
jgi:hypothetical protein